MYRPALALIMLPGVLAGQAILQHSVAATSGTLAGSILGKQLSETLEGVRKATEEGADAADGVTDEARRNERKRDEWKRLTPGSLRTSKASKGKAAVASDGEPATAPAVTRIGPGIGSPTVAVRSWRPRAAEKPMPAAGRLPWQGVLAASYSSQVVQRDEAEATDLRALHEGASRDDVLEKLGSPVARVTIPEEGRFVEVYYYHSNGEPVGAVRLANGAVTEVQLSR